MADLAYLLVQILVCWLVLGLLASQLVSLCYHLFRKLCCFGRAGSRALVQLVYAALGPLVASIGTVLIMHPEWAMMMVPPHCHQGNCLPHPPAIGYDNPAGSLVIVMVVVIFMMALATLYRGLRHAHHRLLALRMLSSPRKAAIAGYAVVDSDIAVAWCAGLLRPRVYISSSLLAQVNDEELAAILAHEYAHLSRRDNLRQLLARWFTLGWTGRQRACFLADFASSCEQACDEIASKLPGGGTVLIHLLERLSLQPLSVSSPVRQSGFEYLNVAERLQVLRKKESEVISLSLAWIFLSGLWLLSMVLLTGVLHRLIEITTFS
ncbi:MAG: M56 family metallopeptidase [Parahaliea sp.]